MPHISRSALVPFSAEQMYKLVDKVDAYHEFLPWCGDSKELDRGDDWVEGSVTIEKGGLNKTFTTKNYLKKNEQIELTLVDGPFKELQGFWRFDALKEDACKISLELDYEFSSRMLSLVVGPVFNQIANAMVDSFVNEARVKYG
jgi:ribosome-associated toxin RatA of RatAB toxin-antitoxin module